MKSVLTRNEEGEVPYIVCPLVNFERGLAGCMVRCAEKICSDCNQIKKVSIEELEKARTGRNPQTGETIKIKAKKAVRFKAGKQLDTALNPRR